MCDEWFILTFSSGYPESNAAVRFGNQAISSSGSSDEVSTSMGDHLVVPRAKLLFFQATTFFSIAMLISHNFSFREANSFERSILSWLISKIMTV